MVPTDITLLIPASGLSRRFGDADKLTAELAGKPLAQHVIDTVESLPFAQRLAVLPTGPSVRRDIFERAGFRCLDNPDPARGMGRSLSIGARTCDSAGLLVMLADMPLVPLGHIKALMAQGRGDHIILTQGEVAQPPALLCGAAIAQLSQADGERGLGGQAGSTLPLPPALLRDVDTPDTLARLSRNWLTLRAQRDSLGL